MALICRAGVAAASILVFATIGAHANPFNFQVNTSPFMSLGSTGSPLVVSPNRQAPPQAVTAPARTVPAPAPRRAVAKPKPATTPYSAVAAQPAPQATPASTVATPPVRTIPVVAKTEDAPAADLTGDKLCARELAAIEPTLRKTLMRVTLAEKAGEAERCSAFREHAEIAAKARELFARCSTGRDRDIDVGQMDGAVLRAKFVMVRMCQSTATTAPR
jgi:hypothetical protein